LSLNTVFQRLKERKLVQWALAYLAGAWVVFEVTDAVGGRWNLPDVLLQGLSVVLAIGFFITLVLAWYHGEKGRQRVSGPELLMVAALLVVAGVALSTLGGNGGASVPAGNAAHSPPGVDRLPAAVLLLLAAVLALAAGVGVSTLRRRKRTVTVAGNVTIRAQYG
jgi:hypothetical protein